MEKPSHSALYADMNVAMAFHFVNCHYVCFIVINGSREASFSLALFPDSPINDPGRKQCPTIRLLSIAVTQFRLMVDNIFQSQSPYAVCSLPLSFNIFGETGIPAASKQSERLPKNFQTLCVGCWNPNIISFRVDSATQSLLHAM
jgi:hypothetical protein